MKEKYTIEVDGFVSTVHEILLAEYKDQTACNQAREDSIKEVLEFLEGWE